MENCFSQKYVGVLLVAAAVPLSSCAGMNLYPAQPVANQPQPQLRTAQDLVYNPATKECYTVANGKSFNGVFSTPTQTKVPFGPKVCQDAGINIGP